MLKKYIIHFTLSLFLIFLIFTILCINDDSVSISVPLITFPISILIYAMPMAFVFSKMAKPIEISLNLTESTLENIDTLITTKLKRSIKNTVNGTIFYTMKNPYFRWLTNAVEVTPNKDFVKVHIPEAYRKDFSKLV